MDHDAAIGGPERALEAAAHVLLETIDTLVVVLDATGRIVLANRALENLLDLSVEKMLGATPFELGVARLDPCADDAGGDVQVRSASGQLRLVAWTSHMVRGADGALQYVVATGTDVTEACATEARLREASSASGAGRERERPGGGARRAAAHQQQAVREGTGRLAELRGASGRRAHAPDRPGAGARRSRTAAPPRRRRACCEFATGTATTAVSRSWWAELRRA
jgi:PAS domain S-box-containing protein